MLQTYRIYYDDGSTLNISARTVQELLEKLSNTTNLERMYKLELIETVPR